MISQLCVLTMDGDLLIQKDYRQELPRNAHEIFFSHYKEEQSVSYCLSVNEIQFVYIQAQNLLFMVCSQFEIAPATSVNHLYNFLSILEDYFGEINEQLFKDHLVFVYEILDEIIDFGYESLSTTEEIEQHLFDSKIGPQDQGILGSIVQQGMNMARSINLNKTQKTIWNLGLQNYVFVEVVEKVSFILMGKNQIQRKVFNGEINVYQFGEYQSTFGLQFEHNNSIDFVQFNQHSQNEIFLSNGALQVQTKRGKMTAVQYVSLKGLNSIQSPFGIELFVIKEGPYKVDIQIVVDFYINEPNKSFKQLTMELEIPELLQSVSISESNQMQYKEDQKIILWKFEQKQNLEQSKANFKAVLSKDFEQEKVRELFTQAKLSFKTDFLLSGFSLKNIEQNSSSNLCSFWQTSKSVSQEVLVRLQQFYEQLI